MSTPWDGGRYERFEERRPVGSTVLTRPDDTFRQLGSTVLRQPDDDFRQPGSTVVTRPDDNFRQQGSTVVSMPSDDTATARSSTTYVPPRESLVLPSSRRPYEEAERARSSDRQYEEADFRRSSDRRQEEVDFRRSSDRRQEDADFLRSSDWRSEPADRPRSSDRRYEAGDVPLSSTRQYEAAEVTYMPNDPRERGRDIPQHYRRDRSVTRYEELEAGRSSYAAYQRALEGPSPSLMSEAIPRLFGGPQESRFIGVEMSAARRANNQIWADEQPQRRMKSQLTMEEEEVPSRRMRSQVAMEEHEVPSRRMRSQLAMEEEEVPSRRMRSQAVVEERSERMNYPYDDTGKSQGRRADHDAGRARESSLERSGWYRHMDLPGHLYQQILQLSADAQKLATTAAGGSAGQWMGLEFSAEELLRSVDDYRRRGEGWPGQHEKMEQHLKSIIYRSRQSYSGSAEIGQVPRKEQYVVTRDRNGGYLGLEKR